MLTWVKFENLLEKDPDSLTQSERAILSSCHWLRLGIFSEDPIEQLIYLYNSLEFAVSGISIPKKFSSGELEKVKQTVENLELSEDQIMNIKNNIITLRNY